MQVRFLLAGRGLVRKSGFDSRLRCDAAMTEWSRGPGLAGSCASARPASFPLKTQEPRD